MPMTAMIRNLGKMSAIQLLQPLSSHAQRVCSQLQNESLLHKARIHPFTILQALYTYRNGHGEKGSLKWDVNQTVVQALDSAFYLTFKVRHYLKSIYNLVGGGGGGIDHGSCKILV